MVKLHNVFEQLNSMDSSSKGTFLSSLARSLGGKNPFTETEGVYQCPHCTSKSIKKNGTSHSYQKYKCNNCNKEFRASTQTCLYYCKRPDRIEQYLSCIFEEMTISAMAQHVGTSRDLAFQWRHKLLESLSAANSAQVKNDAKLVVSQFNYSTKGLDKRKDAKPSPNLSEQPVSVSLLMNHEGDMSVDTCNIGTISPQVLKRKIAPKLDAVRTVTSMPSLQVSRAVNTLNAEHITLKKSQPEIELPYFGKNEIECWLTKFRGVATKYLQHYFNWFVFLKCYESPRQLLQNIIDLHNNRLDIYPTYAYLRDEHAFTETNNAWRYVRNR